MPPFQQLICAGLENNRLEQTVQFLPLPVVGGRYVPDTVLPQQPLYLLPSARRVIYPDRVTAVGVDQLHAGDVGVAVPKINHVAERNTDFVLREKFVDTVVIDVQYPFLYPEKKLGLTCIVDRLRRPFGRPAVIKVKAARKDRFKRPRLRNRRSFNHLFQPGRKDIMLDLYPVLLPESSDPFKPLLDPRIQRNPCAVTLQRTPGQHQVALRFLDHLEHIGKVGVHPVLPCKYVGLLPEPFHIIPDILNISLCLHVVG